MTTVCSMQSGRRVEVEITTRTGRVVIRLGSGFGDYEADPGVAREIARKLVEASNRASREAGWAAAAAYAAEKAKR